ncbi:hypothetical protein [Salimicrobium halophilum]|uniref:Type IV pilus assembly protein PilN n=1 Tax=Salimicrobium halophilum TaxID=86666 RepID=A0A1G8PJI9_9BACI|nr:hypothetical protein [Salimicrobium halophilum]SDI92607.1 hypothetical protein SAMN04490247_0031 [Salimicrobium halophilum]
MAAVQINLLEEREQKNGTPYLLVVGAVVLVLLLCLVFWWQAQGVQEETSQLEAELAELSETETELSTSTDQIGTERQQLQEAVNQLQGEYSSVTELVREMVALLPERGYIEYFALEESNVITMDVRLDNLQETAAYLDLLDEYERTSEVQLLGVTGEEADAAVDPFDYRAPYLASYSIELPGAVDVDAEEEEVQDDILLEP